jgi:hypothetical protein
MNAIAAYGNCQKSIGTPALARSVAIGEMT